MVSYLLPACAESEVDSGAESSSEIQKQNPKIKSKVDSGAESKAGFEAESRATF
ncbi:MULTISPECIES: hypothetical protein [unclassified Helicobacter]|uniref:hypothetical protein n=1 Tax=unclassified Helicobacter TaxID=2593540 RepID=UPI0012E75FF6|nr:MULTISPECIES: hypothetical protein [unclassified Helicobacter]